MLKFARAVALALSFSIALSAQTPVASVTSASSFRLRGARVNPSVAVPTWPVMAGDRIKAGDTPVTLTFADGSTVVLAPKAEAVLRLVDGVPVFELDSEAAHYTLANNSSLKLMARKETVQPRALVGDISFGSDNLPAGWWTASRVAVVAAGAGTAAVLTVGLARRAGPPVSPAQCNNGNGNGNGLPAC
ncbi:MAG: hypothetical protein U0Q11_08205 [Vicinamibacterales bacterium]